ncbi:MAG: hypothetical protein K8F52_05425 [Candidatus Scalindua rubra]|uniref:Uncharacterized protein n=1 Tax=Candidatus Scalindua brodae TaxID=237368 RepID=A0A0B0EM26_9BACT|nr:MAG: hypothetical protein SCABRO_00588 [Candidatus Scalindua brodae]MBZ0108087.1 hypothetical protein [Candidatus Scalindua rubra]
MIQVPGYIKQVIFYTPQFFKAVIFLYGNIPEFIGRGGKSFHTPLYSTDGSINGNNYYFRTIIQSDGDIINIIPSITDIYEVDAHIYIRYKEKYQEHYDKVKKFCAALEGLSTITKAISMFLGLLCITTLNNRFPFGEEWQTQVYMCVIPWTIFSFLFHKFVSRYIFKIIINMVVKGIRAKV